MDATHTHLRGTLLIRIVVDSTLQMYVFPCFIVLRTFLFHEQSIPELSTFLFVYGF